MLRTSLHMVVVDWCCLCQCNLASVGEKKPKKHSSGYRIKGFDEMALHLLDFMF